MEPDDQLLAFAEQAITSAPQPSDALQPEVQAAQPDAQAAQPPRKVMNFGGQELSWPSDWDDSRIDTAMRKYVASPSFVSSIDQNREASHSARLAVGSVSNPQDRLATVRNYYPDAVPYDNDNFVFTDPETNLPTLFNKSGFTLGDVSGFGTDILVGVGGTLGSPFGPAGIAAGTAVTKTVVDAISEEYLGVERSAGLIERTARLGSETLGAVTGARVGELVGPALTNYAKKLLGGGTVAAQRIRQLAESHGIVPTAGMVANGKAAGIMEKSLEGNVATATMMKEQAEKVVKSAADAAAKLASKIGTPRTQQGTGEVIQSGIDKATEQFVKRQGKLESALDKVVEKFPNFGVQVKEIAKLKDELSESAQGATRSLGPVYNDTIKMLQNLIDDANDSVGGLNYRTFRDISTVVGKRMSDMTEGAINKSMMKRVYAAMQVDLEDSLKAFDPTLAAKHIRVKEFTKDFMQTTKVQFDKLSDFDAPEAAYRSLMGSMKDGGSRVKVLFDKFGEQEKRDIAATVVQKMGFQNFGNEADELFSFATFLNNYQKKLSSEAKEIVFGAIDPKLKTSLDELVEVYSAMANNQRLTNFSNTQQAMHAMQNLDILGDGVVDVLMGAATGRPVIDSSAGIVKGLVSRLVMPKMLARKLINADFIKWLSSSAEMGKDVGRHIGLLSAVVADNPELKQPVMSFLNIYLERSGYDINESKSSGMSVSFPLMDNAEDQEANGNQGITQ